MLYSRLIRSSTGVLLQEIPRPWSERLFFLTDLTGLKAFILTAGKGSEAIGRREAGLPEAQADATAAAAAYRARRARHRARLRIKTCIFILLSLCALFKKIQTCSYIIT